MKNKLKLSPKQKGIVSGMNNGVGLRKVFYPKSVKYEFGLRNENKKTVESLIANGIIEVGNIDFGGITKHYYKLTPLGQSLEL